ncbi:unnamed protein product, partial [Didymodactylos carnosus]
ATAPALWQTQSVTVLTPPVFVTVPSPTNTQVSLSNITSESIHCASKNVNVRELVTARDQQSITSTSNTTTVVSGFSSGRIDNFTYPHDVNSPTLDYVNSNNIESDERASDVCLHTNWMNALSTSLSSVEHQQDPILQKETDSLSEVHRFLSKPKTVLTAKQMPSAGQQDYSIRIVPSQFSGPLVKPPAMIKTTSFQQKSVPPSSCIILQCTNSDTLQSQAFTTKVESKDISASRKEKMLNKNESSVCSNEEVYDTLNLIENDPQQKPTMPSVALIKEALRIMQCAAVQMHCLYDKHLNETIKMILKQNCRTILIIHDGRHWLTVSNFKSFRNFSIMDINYQGITKQLFQLLSTYINAKAYGYTYYTFEVEPVLQHTIENDADAYIAVAYGILSLLKFGDTNKNIFSYGFQLDEVKSFINQMERNTRFERLPSCNQLICDQDRCRNALYLIRLRCDCRISILTDTTDYYVCNKDNCYQRIHICCMDQHNKFHHTKAPTRLLKSLGLDIVDFDNKNSLNENLDVEEELQTYSEMNPQSTIKSRGILSNITNKNDGTDSNIDLLAKKLKPLKNKDISAADTRCRSTIEIVTRPTNWCLQCELGQTMNDIRSPFNGYVNPTRLINRLHYIDDQYVVGVQQDAEEFLTQAFNTMDECTVSCRFCYSRYQKIIRENKDSFYWPSLISYDYVLQNENTSESSLSSTCTRYKLYGIIMHQGESVANGHYYSYVKSNNSWKCINDELVTNVNLFDVLNADKSVDDRTGKAGSNAYILCYEQDCDNIMEPNFLENDIISIEDNIIDDTVREPRTVTSLPEEIIKESESDDSDDSDCATKRIHINRMSNLNDHEHDYATLRRYGSLLTRETGSNLLGVDLSHSFKRAIAKCHDLKIEQADLKVIEQKKVMHDAGQKRSKHDARDFTISNIMVKYIKKINPYCSIRIKENRFSQARVRNTGNVLLKSTGKCAFQPTCPFKFNARLQKTGDLSIKCEGSIIHSGGSFKSRPIREDEKKLLHDELAMGVSSTGLFERKLLSVPNDVLNARNLDGVGTSANLYQKIAAFDKKESICNCIQRLGNLKRKYEKELMPNDQVPGIIQVISHEPCLVICVNATALLVWDKIDAESEISWDATGSIIQANDIQKRMLYYEMSLAHPVKGGTIIPITFMISEAHDVVTILYWLGKMKSLYGKKFGYDKDFPSPRYLLNDRAQVLIQAGLQFFTKEDFKTFNERCYRILNGTFMSEDIRKTIPHACCAHIMRDFKILVRMCKIPDDEVKRVMFYCSLLLNSFTYINLKNNYLLFCGYFLFSRDTPQWRTTTEALTNGVRELIKTNMLDTNALIMDEQFFNFRTQDQYDIDNIDFVSSDSNLKKKPQGEKMCTWLSEEAALNEFESSIKTDMTKIFSGVCRTANKERLSILKTKKGKKAEKDDSEVEPELNSYERFICRFNKLYVATVHLWSNILLGDLQRYREGSSINESDIVDKIQRTTGSSEKRMWHYQKPKEVDLKQMENIFLKPELPMYANEKQLTAWKNNKNQNTFANALLQSIVYSRHLQVDISQNESRLSNHHNALRTLLLEAIKGKKKLTEKNIDTVLQYVTNEVIKNDALLTSGSSQNCARIIKMPALKFLKECVYPILGTNVTVASLFRLVCQSCEHESNMLIFHDIIVLQWKNAYNTEKVIEQMLLSCNNNDPCTRCDRNDLLKVLSLRITYCPQVFFVYKQQNSQQENVSYVEMINFKNFLDEDIVTVQYYSLYRLASCVYMKALDEYGAMFYCNDKKYHCIERNNMFVLDKRNIKQYLQSSLFIIYQKVNVEGVDFTNAILAILDERSLLDLNRHRDYSFNEFVVTIKRLYPKIANDLTLKVSVVFDCSYCDETNCIHDCENIFLLKEVYTHDLQLLKVRTNNECSKCHKTGKDLCIKPNSFDIESLPPTYMFCMSQAATCFKNVLTTVDDTVTVYYEPIGQLLITNEADRIQIIKKVEGTNQWVYTETNPYDVTLYAAEEFLKFNINNASTIITVLRLSDSKKEVISPRKAWKDVE